MIVVGVDFSAGSLAALRWALAEAQMHGDRVLALHVGPPLSDLVARTQEVEHRHAEQRARLQAVVDGAGAGATVTVDVADGDAAGVLLARGYGSRLLVVGRRGLGAVGAALAGSVSHDVLRRTECPAAVIPESATAPLRRVVAGVDVSPDALTAVRWAASEAARHGAPLVLVHAVPEGASDGAGRGVLSRVAASIETPVTVEERLARSAAGAALVREAGPDDLLVVGARHRGTVARVLLGSTGGHCLEHASGPVVVVPR